MTKPTPESVAALERELAAARAAQAATAEILAAMNASPGDPQPVFEAVAHHARLLAGAVGAVATRLDGDTLHLVAWSAARGYKQRAKKTFANFPRPLDESALNARAIVHRAPAQVPDLKKAKGFDRKLKQAILEGGAHSLLAIPILHGEDALGSLMVVRTEPGAFDDELVGLLQGFAGQAAQALVNARLIRETRELLERQTATGEVLAAIGSSVADTAPVFEKILDGIEALIPGGIPAVLLIDEHEQIDLAACRGMPEAVARAPFPCPVSGTPTALAIAEQRVLHYPDVAAAAPSQMRSRVKAIGNHAIALAPMIFEGRGIGSIGVVRVPPRPFSDKELALLKTFSDQAAIAVENARLFNDTREALEYQTATADVLRVLGNSMTDSQPVFETILSSAQKLLDANDVGIVLLKADGTARIVAACSDRPDERSVPQSPPDPNSRTVQLIRACEVWHVPDAAAASDLTAVQREQLERYGNHSGLLVPLVWEDRGVGAIAALRFPVRPFSNKEIRLLQTFADQAVIAIENAHLFRETNEALERQTATAEVLETISNSIDDTAPVFERILDSCERLVSADQLSVLLFEDGLIHLAHTRGPLTARASELYPYPVQDSPWADGFTGERVLYVPDSAALDPAPAIMKKVRALIGDASFVSALMVRGNQVIGLINAMRQPPRPFAEKEIGLLRTFADQAVIAIENARLFREINEALEQQTATADVLKVIGTSVEDAAPVFEAILDSCRHLFSTHQIGLFMVNERDEIYLPAIHGEASAGVASAYPMPVADSLFNVPATSLGIEYFPSIAAIEDKARDSEIILEAIGDHSLLVAPMVRGSRAIGFIGVANLPPRSFSDKERSLLQTFADQAVIAIQNARMFRETNEALEQQTATAGILKVIGNSVADTAPVFEEILTRSEHLFSSEEIGIFILREDGLLDIAGYRGSAAAAVRRANPRPLAGTATERAMAAGHALYYPDVEAEPDLPEGVRVMADLIGNFSIVIAPLMWEGRGIGSIVAVHTPPRPFSTKDISLLQTFADQAGIAIENARLFRETNEALERQTATAEVLKVISSSVEDTGPVFEKIIDSCRHLFGTDQIVVFSEHDGMTEIEGFSISISEVARGIRGSYPRPSAGTVHGAAIRAGTTQHYPLVAAGNAELPEEMRTHAAAYGPHSLLAAPMMWEGRGIGTIVVARFPPQPFTDKEAALLTTFADQAVIAVQNSRLFRETNEALEQQTATAEVLSVISRSVEDTGPVFESILAACGGLFGGKQIALCRFTADRMVELAAFKGPRPDQVGMAYPRSLDDSLMRVAAQTRRVAHFPSIKAIDAPPGDVTAICAALDGDLSIILAPLLREDQCIGTINVARMPPRPFTTKEMRLLQTFADQAVIAIQNSRMFHETREALEQQIATADVLKVIGSSVEDAAPAFQRIVDSCSRLFGSEDIVIALERDNGMVEVAALRSELLTEADASLYPMPIDRSVCGVAREMGQPLHFPHVAGRTDLTEDVEHILARHGDHSLLVAPMMKDGRSIGSIVVSRFPARPFSDKDTSLLSTFADQAVIAIENARLFRETNEALERQTALSEVLEVIGSSVEDPAPVFDKVLDSCHALIDCEELGLFVVREDGLVDLGAPWRGYAREGTREFLAASFPRPIEGTLVEIATRERRTLHYPHVSVANDPSGLLGEVAEHFGDFSIVIAPMLWKNRGVGTITAVRTPPRPFAQADIDLISTFAGQAVIAIENARLFRETNEALQRQTATADVLKVIGQSVADTQPVFEKIIESGRKLFETDGVSIYLVRGDSIEVAAIEGTMAGEIATLYPRPLDDSVQGLAVRSAQTVNIAAAEALEHRPGDMQSVYEFAGNHSVMVAPMLWEGRAIGAILVGRVPPRPFMDDEVALLSTFADQAVIAIQNARLFNETKEALEQKSATAEVLRVISDSVEDTSPVFEKIIESCSEIFHSPNVAVFLLNDSGQVEQAASMSPASKIDPGVFPRPATDSVHGLVARSRKTLMIPSVAAVEARPGDMQRYYEAAGDHSLMIAPMTWEGQVIGTIVVAALPPRPFSDSETSLLTTFAGQAVIAIQNARLFRETNEALQRQTATAEVLRVISQSVEDTNPVFEKILDSCQTLFESEEVGAFVIRDDQLHSVGFRGSSREAVEATHPRPKEDTASWLAIQRGEALYYPDTAMEPGLPLGLRAIENLVGRFSIVIAPMLLEGRGVGSVVAAHVPPRPFDPQDIALLQTFADQAVIAIENSRLFHETNEALEQQTATAEVLRAISESVADTAPVFEIILNSCQRLFGTEKVLIAVLEGDDHVRVMLGRGAFAEKLHGAYPDLRVPIGDTLLPQMFRDRATVSVARVSDTADMPESALRIHEQIGDFSMMGAPMMREGRGVGAIWVFSSPPRAFTAKEVDLCATFADQAVIAIENSRLFRETNEALEQQTATAEVLREISSSVSDTAPVFGKILDSCLRLFTTDQAGVYLVRDGMIHLEASRGTGFERIRHLWPRPLTEQNVTMERPIHFVSARALPHPPAIVNEALAIIGDWSQMSAPMIWEGRLVGVIMVTRQPPRPFSERERALLTTFADQAVIAIENARLFHEIEDKSRQLEAANQHKSEFLANMSHELRTPLNAVIGFSEVLIERMFGDLNEKQEDYLKDIHASGKHLLSLINDILDLSKIEAGRMELEVEDFDLRAALDNALTLIRERAERHGIALALETAEDLDGFRADQRKFKQVMLNLLSNAVKFTPDGGRITVRARLAEADLLEVAVADTGIGIAPEYLETIFEEFRQAGGSYTNKQEGTGLGLSLTRRIVELHGGSIGVESEPGAGATFTFTLPRQP